MARIFFTHALLQVDALARLEVRLVDAISAGSRDILRENVLTQNHKTVSGWREPTFFLKMYDVRRRTDVRQGVRVAENQETFISNLICNFLESGS